MKNTTRLIGIAASTMLLISCGNGNTNYKSTSDGDTGMAQTWRLSHSEIPVYKNTRLVEGIFKGDHSFNYDQAGEIIGQTSYYTATQYLAITTVNGEKISEEVITQEQVAEYNALPDVEVEITGIAHPCFAEGDVYQTSSITNVSAQEWENAYSITAYSSLPSSDENPDCGELITLTPRLTLSDWGDNAIFWNTPAEPWPELTPEQVSEFTSEPVSELPSGFNVELTPATLTADDLALVLPKQNTQRQYDTNGYITTIDYTDAPVSEQIVLTWENGLLTALSSTLTKADPTYEPMLTYRLRDNIVFRYDYSEFEFGKVTVQAFIDTDGELTLVQTITAIYEQAPCGPMTQERSQKYIPDPLPICLTR